MQTAKLELINPYAKYGLKRRPTYEEIAGLIYENQALAGELPDRVPPSSRTHHRALSSTGWTIWKFSRSNRTGSTTDR